MPRLHRGREAVEFVGADPGVWTDPRGSDHRLARIGMIVSRASGRWPPGPRGVSSQRGVSGQAQEQPQPKGNLYLKGTLTETAYPAAGA